MTELEQLFLYRIKQGGFKLERNPYNRDIIRCVKDEEYCLNYYEGKLRVEDTFVDLDIHSEVIAYFNNKDNILKLQQEKLLLDKLKGNNA